jgi:hypothetical protein
MQTFVVYVIVGIALLYAAWLFLPIPARRALARWLVRFAPASQRGRLASLQANAGSAGCSTCQGCASDDAAIATPVKTIQLHRR